MSDSAPTPHWTRLVGRALIRHCPVCGSGHIFRRWLLIAERCPRCGLVFERQEGHFVGAVGMNTIITFGAVMLSVVIGTILTAPDIAIVPLLAVSMGLAVVLPIVIHPTCRMLWTAIDLLMHPLEPGEAPFLTNER